MTNRTRKTIFSTALGSLALLAVGCSSYDGKVEVANGCGQTVVFANYEVDAWHPDSQEEMFAKVEWITLEQGESTVIPRVPHTSPEVTLTVVADGADRVWDPVPFDVTHEDPDNLLEGKIELMGDNCG